MGTGIAKVAITNSKIPVILMDVNESALKKSISFIDSLLVKDASKGLLKEDKSVINQRITTTQTLSDFSNVDFVIEAASEDPTLIHYF